MPFAGRNTDLQRSYHGRATDLHGRHTDTRRTGHGQDTDNRRTAVAGRPPYHGLLTDGRRAGFGQTWTSPDVPRWAAADCAAHGLETDWRRVRDNARGCLRTLRVRLTPNLPSESIRFLRHIYHEYAQRTTHGRVTDFPYRTSSSPSSPLSPRAKVTPDRVAPQEGADTAKKEPRRKPGFFFCFVATFTARGERRAR